MLHNINIFFIFQIKKTNYSSEYNVWVTVSVTLPVDMHTEL